MPAHAQVAMPSVDGKSAEQARNALARAAAAWGEAGLVPSTAGATSAAVLTSKAALAGTALVQASGALAASLGVVHVYATRVGSISTFGNPWGGPARLIAFPLMRKRPVPKPYPVPQPDDEKTDKPRKGRVYATYYRYNRRTRRYYLGRTSMVIDLNQDWLEQAERAVQARNRNRHADESPEPSKRGFERAELDAYAVGRAVDYGRRYQDLAYLAIRGREQQLIDFRGARRAKELGLSDDDFTGGARSDTAPGEPLTENAIRGVAHENPMGELFHESANLVFGEIAPYTGDWSL